LDKVVHFERPADDISRAKDFYSSVHGRQLDDMPGAMDYTIVRTVDVDEEQNAQGARCDQRWNDEAILRYAVAGDHYQRRWDR
jgi:predicted enzyme related to lactoylglutathione lyase